MGFYLNTFNDLKGWLEGNATINEVQWGDVNEFDTTTITNFPLAYIIHTGMNSEGAITTFKFQIILATTLQEETDTANKAFDLLADVVIDLVRSGQYTIENQHRYNDADVVYDQRANRVYGYVFDVDITIKSLNEGC